MGILKKLLDKVLDTEIPFTAKSDGKQSVTVIEKKQLEKPASNFVRLKSNDLWDGIPQDVKKLLFTSFADKPKYPGLRMSFTIDFSGKINEGNTERTLADDPSTIYFKALISEPADPSLVPRPPYYPSYVELTPEQRYIYLKWLQDISKEIDVGYKFIFYYGLERHLLLGDFDNAFDMIIRLRKNTTNNSFLSYSVGALLYSAMIKSRPDSFHKLIFLFDDEKWYYDHLLVKVLTDDTINSTELIKLLKTQDINKRYINTEPRVYSELMDSLLYEKYGHPYIIPSDYVNKTPSKVHEGILFANISFPEECRTSKKIPALDKGNFYTCITDLHNQCHELTKLRLAESRKKKPL